MQQSLVNSADLLANGVGRPVASLDTPALLVDLDAFERNVRVGFERLRGTGVRMRPHLKTGKSPAVAARLLRAGANGICVSKLGEAEVFAQAGVEDILITTEVVGAGKLERLAGLVREHCGLKIVLDSAEGARLASEAMRAASLTLSVLIELNVGQDRCGVQPEEALALAREIACLPGLCLVGVQGYEGNLQHVRDPDERRRRCDAAMESLSGAVASLERAGFPLETVTTGGTGTYAFCAEHAAVNEVQPGSFVFMDADYLDTGGLPFGSALTVLATVISRPGGERAVLDAGLKALSTDSGFARPRSLVGWTYQPGGDEHGLLRPEADLDPSLASALRVGDVVELVPSHCDTTINLHDLYFAHRGGIVEEVWPISARGKSR